VTSAARLGSLPRRDVPSEARDRERLLRPRRPDVVAAVSRRLRTNAPYRTDADLTSYARRRGVYVDATSTFSLARASRWRPGRHVSLRRLEQLRRQSVGNPSTSIAARYVVSQRVTNGQYREPFQRSTTASGRDHAAATPPHGRQSNHFAFTPQRRQGARHRSESTSLRGQHAVVKVQSQDFGVSYDANLGESLNLSAKSVLFQTHVRSNLVFDPTVKGDPR